MNHIIKKLLLEIMSYSNTRKVNKEDTLIKKAQEKLGDRRFYVRSQNLLSWIDPKYHFSNTNTEKYVLYEDFMDTEDFLAIYKEYQLLFEYLPELKELFELKELHIGFNPHLSKNNIQNIHQFVKNNYTIDSKRTTRYYKDS